MSCALNTLVSIRNINSIIEWFQLDGEVQEDTVWDTNWENWDDCQLEKEVQKPDQNWLEKCLSCISPMGNMAVIAHKNRIAIMTASDLVDDRESLSVAWKGTVGDVDDDEITDVMCLPLSSPNTSSAGTPDWTAIIVGFKSGYVSVYAENGMLIFSQIYEECPVVKLYCRTYTLGDFGIPHFSDLSDEFVVAYQTCIASINGDHFLNTLRQCRKRAAKASAGSMKLEDLPPVKYKKYSLQEQGHLNSCVSAGSLTLRLYEKLMQESLYKGFTDHVGGGLVSKGHLITVGEMPYFGIIELHEESSPIYLRDLAVGLASLLKDKVMSAATDWLFPLKVSSNQEPSKPKIEPAAPAAFKTFLPDRRRVGSTVALSPSRRLAAVTDSFGRVVVIDVVRGVAVRMWKGYRDAECGWQEVVGEWGREKRKVTFLVIYAPRRGLLEVWLPQQGQRIAAFNVSKHSRLLYTHHIVLGFACSIYEVYHSFPVLLLNSSGIIERIYIPFHLALSTKSDRQARDQHLLKEIKKYLNKMDEYSVISLTKELETVFGKLQFITMILSAKKFSLSLFENVLEVLSEETDQQEEIVEEKRKEAETVKVTKSINESEYSLDESKKLNLYLLKIDRLIKFYKYITTPKIDTSHISINEDETKKILAKMILINLDEVDHLPIFSSEEVQQHSIKKVKFEKETGIEFHSYMNLFQIIGSDCLHECDIPIDATKSVSDHVKIALTDLIFSHCEEYLFEEFLKAVIDSGIKPFDLVEFLYIGWNEMKEKSISSATKFSLIVTGFFFLNGEFFPKKGDLSVFWSSAMICIYSWTNIPLAHLTAIICRGLEQTTSSFLHNVLNIQKDEEVDRICIWRDYMQHLQSEHYNYVCLNEWEQTTPEMVEWNIFIERIKSLTGLYEMLRKQQSNASISVKCVIDNGCGYISELVAIYIIQSEISPNSLLKILTQCRAMKDGQSDEACEELDPELKAAYEDIACVKKNFEISLNDDSIFCNVCWEFGVLWHKNTNETQYLTRLVDFFRILKYTDISAGTGILIWQFLLRDRLCTITELTQKFQRMPSDRISMDKIGISHTALAEFFIESKRFLNSLLDLLVEEKISAESTSINDSFWNYIDRPSLVDRAKNVIGELSPHMLYLHVDLIYVLDIIKESNLTDIRVHSLFSDEQRRMLFEPLTECIHSGKFLIVNPTVLEGRIEFMKKIISIGVEQLPDDFDDLVTKIVPMFFTKIIDLAQMWNCNADIFRRQYVIELLYSGFDTRSENASRWLNLLGDLPESIFVIAGLRLKYLIDTLPGPKLVKLMTSISPLITNWTRTLIHVPLRNPGVAMVKTKLSMESMFPYLPETSSHYTPGKYFLMACDNIIEEGF